MIVRHHEKRMKDPAAYTARFRPEGGKFTLSEAFLDGTMPYCLQWQRTGKPNFVITCTMCKNKQMPAFTRTENFWDQNSKPKARQFLYKTCATKLSCIEYIERAKAELGEARFRETVRKVDGDLRARGEQRSGLNKFGT